MPFTSTSVDREVPIALKSQSNARWPQRAVAFLVLGLAAVLAENTAIAAASDYEAPGPVETATLVQESLLDVPQARVDPRA